MIGWLTTDPDFQLHTRLTQGRSPWWRWLLLWAGSAWLWPVLRLLAARRAGEGGSDVAEEVAAFLLFLATAGLSLLAPLRAVTRLMDWERNGSLDHVRLCGRPPHRVLLVSLAGALWPLLPLAVLPCLGFAAATGEWGSLLVPAYTFLIGTGAALLFFTLSPVASTPLPYVGLTILVGWVPAECLGPLLELLAPTRLVRRLDFMASLLLCYGLIAALAFLGAARRVRRRAWGRQRSFVLWSVRAMRGLSAGGAIPELRRALVHTLASRGSVAALLLFPPLFGLRFPFESRDVGALTHLHLLVVFLGVPLGAWLSASAFARREQASGNLDLVRLTPQSSGEIVLGWVAGTSLPFLLMVPLCGLAVVGGGWATLARRHVHMLLLYEAEAPLVKLVWTLLLLVPVAAAFAVQESLRSRPRGSYLAFGSWALFGLPIIGPSSPLELRLASPPGAPPVLLWTLAALGLAAAVAGSLARPEGPALRGPLAATSAFALAALWAWFAGVSPFLYVFLFLVLGSSLFAEERRAPSAPARRLWPPALGALAGAALGAWSAGPQEAASLGLTAGLTVIAGILAHELTWKTPGASMGLRTVLMVAIGSLALMSVGGLRQTPSDAQGIHGAVRSLGPPFVLGQGALAAALLLLHRRRRGQRDSNLQ